MSTLYVKNEAQRVIFLQEMQGQLSDGYWENCRTWEHWKPWCKAEVVVSDKIGRDFWASKYNYNFSAKELIDVVGERIIFKVKAFMLMNLGDDEMRWVPDGIEDYQDHLRYAEEEKDPKGYWHTAVVKMHKLGLNAEKVAEIEASKVYTKKDLMKDLAGLKEAARIKVD